MEAIINNTDAQMQPDKENINAISPRYGFYVIVVSVFWFQSICWLVNYVGIPKSVRDDPWKWRNCFVSWIHALMCGIWSISCFLIYPEMIQDLVTYSNYWLFSVVAFSTGYFIHDSLDIIMNNRVKKMWEVQAHHCAVIPVLLYNTFANQCIGYQIVSFIAEVNSIFLHARKLLQMSQVSWTGGLYRAVSLVNFITFAFCRSMPFFVIVNGMYTEGFRISTFNFVMLSITMALWAVLNPILFWRLLKSDVLRRKDRNGNDNIKKGKSS